MKKVLTILAVVLILGVVLRASLKLEAVQNLALDQVARLFVMQGGNGPDFADDELKILVCGSASPLGRTGQAQACIAVVTPEHYYVFDAGAGSANNIAAAGLPGNRLQGVFLTHFHSDHIAELYELNLGSWVQGRPQPLNIIGPAGVQEIVDATNMVYRQDRQYRVAHHGAELLPTALGVLDSSELALGETFTDGDLTVRSYKASHDPVEPAVGYRVEYKGRSVVISGDSNVDEQTVQIVDGVDLLLHDALSVPIVSTLSEAAAGAGMSRVAKIMADVLDYHASTTSLVELGQNADIGMVAYYHLVPSPANAVMEEIFKRDFADNYVLASDGMWFTLPVGSDAIHVVEP